MTKASLTKLERNLDEAGAQAQPWLVFTQCIDDFDLWHGPGANVWQDDTVLALYTRDVLDDLDADYGLILVSWDQNWREEGSAHVNLSWGDD